MLKAVISVMERRAFLKISFWKKLMEYKIYNIVVGEVITFEVEFLEAFFML